MYTLTQNDKDFMINCAGFCAVTTNTEGVKGHSEFVVFVSQGKDRRGYSGLAFPDEFKLPSNWKLHSLNSLPSGDVSIIFELTPIVSSDETKS